MTYRGHVKNGVVVLERKARLPEGTTVDVQPLPSKKKISTQESLGQRLLKFAGTVPGLPKDMARNHDHYIHGKPRK
jgi:hypothetical protein